MYDAASLNFGSALSQPAPVSIDSASLVPSKGLSYSTLPELGLPSLASPGAGGVFGTGLNGIEFADGALKGLQTIANIWNAFEARKLAKDQFNFTKDITKTNLANQMKSYNTALADRARSRAVVEGQSNAQMQSYIDQNSLSRTGH